MAKIGEVPLSRPALPLELPRFHFQKVPALMDSSLLKLKRGPLWLVIIVYVMYFRKYVYFRKLSIYISGFQFRDFA